MSSSDYGRIEQAINFLQGNFREQPRLADISATVGLSEYHFQRLFRRWAGISPKRFLQYLTGEYVSELLRNSSSVLEASLDAGLSGPGRLHDLLVNLHGVTPGELKRHGEGLEIRYGIHPSPFGDCLLSTTGRGICGLAFLSPDSRKTTLAELQQRWPEARFREHPQTTQPIIERIFSPGDHPRGDAIDLYVQGTNFQLKVWEALLRIPPGMLVSYGDIAKRIGIPKAARAVGTANAQNPVALLIPCHRVIRKSGAFGEYRWGETRKQAMFAWEAARVHA